MTNYAFLDGDDNVVGLSTMDRSLATAQAQLSSAVLKLSGVPDGLILKRECWCEQHLPHYHQKVTGDGTDIDDYSLVWDLDELKARKIVEIDAKTDLLIVSGFEYPVSSGVAYSLSANAQIALKPLNCDRSGGMSRSCWGGGP